MRSVGRFWIILACLVLLAACGSDDAADDPGPEATPPVASPTATVPDMAVSQIVWTESVDEESGEPISVVEVFGPQSQSIIAAIEVSEVPAGTTFSATWTINDQPIEGTMMEITASEDMPHAWINFSFTRDPDQRYPVGQLGVVITTSEGDLREGSVEIGFP